MRIQALCFAIVMGGSLSARLGTSPPLLISRERGLPPCNGRTETSNVRRSCSNRRVRS